MSQDKPANAATPDAQQGPSGGVLIVDFGAQYCQLIARRVRELGVYSRITVPERAMFTFAHMRPQAVILSGGPDKPDQLALSDLMREVLETELRVSPMWVERKSQTTAENARYVSEILRNHGIAHIYLITHAWHMPRAAAAFRHMNVTVTPAPTGFINNRASPSIQDFLPSPWALSATGYALHEWLGLLWYTLRGDVGDGM